MLEVREIDSVMCFGDGSELVHLIDADCYVWQRPIGGLRSQVSEVVILAESDRDALSEVRKIAEQELVRLQMAEAVA